MKVAPAAILVSQYPRSTIRHYIFQSPADLAMLLKGFLAPAPLADEIIFQSGWGLPGRDSARVRRVDRARGAHRRDAGAADSARRSVVPAEGVSRLGGWRTPSGNPINPFSLVLLALSHIVFAPSFAHLRWVAAASGLVLLAANFVLCRRISA